MSYAFNMGFLRCKTLQDALMTAFQCVESVRRPENTKQLLERNALFCPSERWPGKAHPYEDENWVRSLFTLRFIYWSEHELLGLVGDIPGAAEFRSVYFQNSTDHDYEFSDWPDIPFFNDIVKRHEHMTVDELVKTGRWEGFTAEELGESLDYHRRTDVYDEVVERLALDIWLLGEQNSIYQCFSMCALQNTEDAMEMAALARKLNQ